MSVTLFFSMPMFFTFMTNNSPRNNDDSSKEMFERQNNEIIRRKLDTKEIERNSVVKVVNKERKDSSKKSNSFKEEIDERLKSIVELKITV